MKFLLAFVVCSGYFCFNALAENGEASPSSNGANQQTAFNNSEYGNDILHTLTSGNLSDVEHAKIKSEASPSSNGANLQTAFNNSESRNDILDTFTNGNLSDVQHGKIKSKVSKVFGKVKSKVTKVVGKIKNKVTKVVNKIKNKITGGGNGGSNSGYDDSNSGGIRGWRYRNKNNSYSSGPMDPQTMWVIFGCIFAFLGTILLIYFAMKFSKRMQSSSASQNDNPKIPGV